MNIIKTLGLSMLMASAQLAIADETNEHHLELKINGRYFSDDGHAHASMAIPDPKKTEYDQSALGMELNYQSPYFNNIIGLDASVYAAVNLGDSGNPTVQLFDVQPNGHLKSHFASLGILALKAKLGEGNELRIGRQKVNTMFIKSTFNRAVPDTFSGASLKLKPLENLDVYAGYYNKWQPRTADKFTSFVTDNNEKIKYVALLGAKYKFDRWTVNAEYLHSDNYLSKYGAIVNYALPLTQSQLNLRSGILFSQDAGNLFKCGAEADLDCVTKGQDMDNNGQGYFAEVTWKKNDLELGAAVTKINGAWIEDSYSTQSARDNVLIQDNGTNPFPTAAIVGPDFSNKDELAWMARVKYNWQDYVKGLSTEFKHIRGTGAHQSDINSDIEGKEYTNEFTVAYKPNFMKNLDFRYSYLVYHSSFDHNDSMEKINGLLKHDWHQHRVALTYTYQF